MEPKSTLKAAEQAAKAAAEERLEKIMAEKKVPPLVFVSYSHDSKAHKAWVLDLAEKLVNAGIETILDQWELGPGDDVAKFMERGVSKANRVLMICTEAYVQKADAGKGGVGYEAMIVTGELMKDLGADKFIPVVRQAKSPRILPQCVSTRLFVDLGDGKDLAENFEQLLREIHAAPKQRKPPLGNNPFACAFDNQVLRIKLDNPKPQVDQLPTLDPPEFPYNCVSALGTSFVIDLLNDGSESVNAARIIKAKCSKCIITDSMWQRVKYVSGQAGPRIIDKLNNNCGLSPLILPPCPRIEYKTDKAEGWLNEFDSLARRHSVFRADIIDMLDLIYLHTNLLVTLDLNVILFGAEAHFRLILKLHRLSYLHIVHPKAFVSLPTDN